MNLPDYIAVRNRLAITAGLTIEKQQQNGTRLLTWYRGTEAQWRASPFCQRDKPFLTRPGSYMRDFECFALSSCGYATGRDTIYVRPLKGGDYRGVLDTEDLPEWADDVGDGITAYGLIGNNGPVVAYVGQLDAMIARSIAPEAAREHECAPVDGKGWRGGYAWHRHSLPDGRTVFCDNVGERERYNREQSSADAAPLMTTATSASDWIEHHMRLNNAWLTVTMRGFTDGGPNREGKVFALARESREAVQEAMDELLDAIRQARVIVSGVDKTSTVQAQRARADQAFRAFLTRSGVPAPNAPA